MDSNSIGIIGIGKMGGAIARNLNKKGYRVLVFDLDEAKLEEFKKLGCKVANSVLNLLCQSEKVILSLPNSNAVEEVVLGENGLLSGDIEGKVIIDCSSSYPPSTIEIAKKVKSVEAEFIDAPITGVPADAEKGEINLIIGGNKNTFKKCLPLFKSMSANIFHVGPCGSGHLIKILSNYAGLSQVANMCEILSIINKFDIDPKDFWEVIKVSAANSRIYELFMPRILNQTFDYSFSLDLANKDLRYVCDSAHDKKSFAPVANMVLQEYDLACSQGLGKQDVSELIKIWDK